MKMDEKLIALHMRTLKCTREEAIQLIKDDAETDRGIAHDWDLTPEQRKNARQYTRTGTRKVTAQKPRTRKENPVKRAVISMIAESVNGMETAENVRISNAEKSIDFTIDGISYTVTLTAHRASKN